MTSKKPDSDGADWMREQVEKAYRENADKFYTIHKFIRDATLGYITEANYQLRMGFVMNTTRMSEDVVLRHIADEIHDHVYEPSQVAQIDSFVMAKIASQLAFA